MPEDIRRSFLLQLHIYRYGMALVRTDQGVIFIEGIALFLIRTDDFFQNLQIQRMTARLIDTVNQVPDIRPTMLIESDPNRFRLMAQDQGNELACIFISIGSPAPHL